MHFLITRPKNQADPLLMELQKMGHSAMLAPLLEITLEKPILDLHGLQALILTSQNAVRALVAHPDSQDIQKIPVIAVGKGTAAVARQAGFKILVEGKAGAEDLAEHLKVEMDPKRGRLLYVSGDVLAFDMQSALRPLGFNVHRSVVYRTMTVNSLPEKVTRALLTKTLDGILLLSPRTSQVWVDLISSSDLKEAAQKVVHFCLSDAVAAPLEKFKRVKIKTAIKPNLNEFLVLIRDFSSSLPT